MWKSPKLKAMRLGAVAALLAGLCVAQVQAEPAKPSKGFGLGRAATVEEIQAWDIDVRPDGQGLPKGKGNAAKGEAIFAAKCAICHGDFAEGVDRWPVLAGGIETLKSDDPVKTVGSYWPYLSTAYDYIYRAMPYGNAQTLKPDEVYSIIAYILLMNDVIEDDQFELSNENFASVRLPNEKNFIDDPRPDTATLKQAEPCMKDCKPDVKVTKRARILDVTPKNEDDNAGRGAID
jgi:S-disulfanyl-L-cysteine oxidoreductase SoxD